jgi:UDP-N-acetylglucosamine--N-acetylmuramyl-(pentapeptide) pyrophosphoryl-undecaprenol N-acetylglucosamine transferase
MRFIIACGGSGGHVFPGVATGHVLQKAGHEVDLWLAGKSIETKTIKGWSGSVATIPMDWGLTSSSVALFRTTFSLLRAWFDCRRRLRKNSPDVLLAMGSRASLIPVAAARSLGIPVVLHESNVMPGKAIEFLSRRFLVTVALGFAETALYLPGRHTVVTGFPLRDMTPTGPLPGLPPGPAPAILVMGGSQSSTKVNELGCDALIRLHRSGIPLRVIHLAGTKQEQAIRKAYADAGVPHVVFGFLHDMGAAYASASLAISRAGAASCAELASFGVPAFFIPYPHAGNHQRLNALAMDKAGAAVMRTQDSLSVEGLANRIGSLLADPAALARMRDAALKASTPDAANRLADLLIQSSKEPPRP